MKYKLIPTTMMKNLLIILMILTAVSCSKDDESNPPPVIEVSNFEVLITSITTNSANIRIDYTVIDLSPSTTKKVFYKELNATEWQESLAGKIVGLKPGIKYIAKAVLSIENLKEESPEVIFTTLGFNHHNLTGDRILFNREFKIYNGASNNDFNEAAILKGFLKVENDSLELKDIEIISDFAIKITLPDNTQDFFKNDEEYVEIKPFTIGLFSGEYYTEITESFIWLEDPIIKDFSLYNKLPQIKTVTQEQFTCEETGTPFYKLKLKGNFWTLENGFYDNSDTYNNPKLISLTISNVNNPEIFKIFSKEEDMAYDKSNYSSDYCEKETYYSFEIIAYNPFHSLENMHVNLSSENFPKGDYKLKFDVIDYNDQEYKSNEYIITLD